MSSTTVLTPSTLEAASPGCRAHIVCPHHFHLSSRTRLFGTLIENRITRMVQNVAENPFSCRKHTRVHSAVRQILLTAVIIMYCRSFGELNACHGVQYSVRWVSASLCLLRAESPLGDPHFKSMYPPHPLASSHKNHSAGVSLVRSPYHRATKSRKLFAITLRVRDSCDQMHLSCTWLLASKNSSRQT